jgi:acetyltransferase
MDELFAASAAIGYQPSLEGDRIAIITNAGGPGILATDALERAGLSLARFTNETIQKLVQFLPDAASAANPVDVLGDALSDRYQFAIDTVANDANVDGLLVLLTPQAMTEIDQTATAVGELSFKTDKPVLGCFMGEKQVKSGIDILTAYNVPNYSFPVQAAKAFKAMADYRLIRSRPLPEFVQFEVDRESVRDMFNGICT